ncbi:diguanylate cyclase [Opitutaceae bacterium TAV4]|uniref:GGDEF domain-containing protein n=1 Tax=Geminisphaera colitermitum TaxID=1148786 RepID=UPI000158CAC3|nr:diguanylate cyclase [Geminisphaera colitermitum]RRJ96544.1 diguanylate cyclase [Opitutaceae bacterium TAV4]RRK00596.1 diguanylate cyclase [Opitutaceae bacterium TAV3]
MRKVLLIDDDRLQSRVIAQMFTAFRRERFVVEWAPDYESGLTRLLSGEFAACLLDYQLGPRDGLALLREAMARGCPTPIVFLTAETSARVDAEALDSGALDYLVKGEINPAALERSLRYALRLGDTLAQLRLRATHDTLTGLNNRHEFERLLADELERARLLGHPLSLVMCDIDHFKTINDTRGHAAGDAVLREVASRLRSALRASDRIGRFGGEEFAVLLAGADQEAARHIAVRMVAAVAASPITPAPFPGLSVTISAGVAGLRRPQPENTVAALFAAADQALYAAKHAGRNRVVLAPAGALVAA